MNDIYRCNYIYIIYTCMNIYGKKEGTRNIKESYLAAIWVSHASILHFFLNPKYMCLLYSRSFFFFSLSIQYHLSVWIVCQCSTAHPCQKGICRDISCQLWVPLNMCLSSKNSIFSWQYSTFILFPVWIKGEKKT